MKNRVFLISLALYGLFGVASWTNLIQRPDVLFFNNDFCTLFWYPGVYLRSPLGPGRNPFTSLPTPDNLNFPIYFIDGTIATEYSHMGTVNYDPTNLSLTLLLTFPLSFFSWNSAKYLWFFLNILFSLGTVYYLTQLTEARNFKFGLLFIGAIFFSLRSTQYAFVFGQSTLLTLFSMCIALHYMNKNYWIPGIALAIALSKYSLGFPIGIVFFCWRQWRAIFVAVVLHLTAMFIIGVITETSLLHTLQGHINHMLNHIKDPFLSYYLLDGLLKDHPTINSIVVLFTTIILIFTITLFYFNNKNIFFVAKKNLDLEALLVISVFNAVNMLLISHRRYDQNVHIMFVAIILFNLLFSQLNPLVLSNRQQITLFAFILSCLFVWIFPMQLFISDVMEVKIYNVFCILVLVISYIFWVKCRIDQTRNSLQITQVK
ncbi:MAG: DUF2029 domain-containing protein [Anaerolineae bacterium]|nr:DUF2029 domain-containing protein [Anaerolineae bacterium]